MCHGWLLNFNLSAATIGIWTTKHCRLPRESKHSVIRSVGYDSRLVKLFRFPYSMQNRKDPFIFEANTFSAVNTVWAVLVNFWKSILSIFAFPNTRVLVFLGKVQKHWLSDLGELAWFDDFTMFTYSRFPSRMSWDSVSIVKNHLRQPAYLSDWWNSLFQSFPSISLSPSPTALWHDI